MGLFDHDAPLLLCRRERGHLSATDAYGQGLGRRCLLTLEELGWSLRCGSCLESLPSVLTARRAFRRIWSSGCRLSKN